MMQLPVSHMTCVHVNVEMNFVGHLKKKFFRYI